MRIKLINAEKFAEAICKFPAIDEETANAVIFLLQEQPTADVEEVKHGEWIPTNDDNKKLCSRCDVIHLIAQYPDGQANYCPNCGAKMDGGNDE